METILPEFCMLKIVLFCFCFVNICIRTTLWLGIKSLVYSFLPVNILGALLCCLLELNVAVGVSKVSFIVSLSVFDLFLFLNFSKGCFLYLGVSCFKRIYNLKNKRYIFLHNDNTK